MVYHILICHKGSSLEIKRKRKDLKSQDSLEVLTNQQIFKMLKVIFFFFIFSKKILNLNNESTNFQNVEKVIFFFHFLKKKFQLS